MSQQGEFLVDLIMQADLILIEGQKALLGTTPVVGVELGLGQPSKDLLSLQFGSYSAVVGFLDEIPNDLGVSMIGIILSQNESHIVSLETFLHHAEHPKHLVIIQLDVDRQHVIDINHVIQAVRPSNHGKILPVLEPVHFILESSIVGF
jgi:hypothetical protein